MHLEEADVRLRLEDLAEMLGLEPDARRCWQVAGDQSHAQAFFSTNSMVWPMPVGEVGEAVFSQVPFGT